MSSGEKHHLLEGLKVGKTDQQIEDLLIDFTFASIYHLYELVHIESLDVFFQSLKTVNDGNDCLLE